MGRFGGASTPLGGTATPRQASEWTVSESLLSLAKVKPLELPPVPQCFLCPLSKQVLQDPVIAADGVTYERERISAHIGQGGVISPSTGQPLESNVLRNNEELKAAIEGYMVLRGEIVQQWQGVETDVMQYLQQAYQSNRQHHSWRALSSSPGPALSPSPITQTPLSKERSALQFDSQPQVSRRPSDTRLPEAPARAVLGSPVGSPSCPFQAGPAPRSARGERSFEERNPAATACNGAAGRQGERSALESLKAALVPLTPRLGNITIRSSRTAL